MNDSAFASRHDLALTADPRRVIIKLFMPGEDAVLVRRRTHALVDRIASLGEEETKRLPHQAGSQLVNR